MNAITSKYVLQQLIQETTHALTNWDQEDTLHFIKSVITN